MELALFLVVSFVAVASGGVAVFHRDPARAVPSLAVALLAVSLLFVPLGAPWLAALHAVVLAGATLTVFRKLRDDLADTEDPAARGAKLPRAVVALMASLFAGVLIYLSRRQPPPAEGLSGGVPPAAGPGSDGLIGSYLLPLQMGALLLLAAAVGVTFLARPGAERVPAGMTSGGSPQADEEAS